jgi:UDP-N-acetylmuramate dehydrogenase
MKILENISLAKYSTMRLGGEARYFVEVSSEDNLLKALDFAKSKNIPFHILGGGSNSIFQDAGFPGLVITMRIMGIEETEASNELQLAVSAGEIWDNVVELSTRKGYFDIAALSLIPGTVGAAPVQNIGAYGQQVSDVIDTVRAYDTSISKFVEIPNDDCGFKYRQSRFNTTDKKQFIITSVTMRFSRKSIAPPFYSDITNYLKSHHIDEDNITPIQLREAVSSVRVMKLPDPASIASCGSFFKNPLVSTAEYDRLSALFPELKSHQTDDGNLKLYAGQLIELCGLKDFHDQETGLATWKNQALVVVNESAKNTNDLLEFKTKIIDSVKNKFQISLEQEPELIAS